MWAKNVVKTCLNIKKGEKVLLVCDEKIPEIYSKLQEEILKCEPKEFWTIIFPKSSRPIAKYPENMHKLAKEVDVIIKLFSEFDMEKEIGAYIDFMPSFHFGNARMGAGSYIDSGILKHELMADYTKIAKLTNKVSNALKGKDKIHLTTEKGTDLTLSIKGREIKADTGLIHNPKQYGNLPAGEVYVAPLEDSATGKAVIDLSFPQIVIKNPVTLIFKNGRIISIEGKKEAKILEKRILEGEKKNHGDWCRVIGELGIGTNENARLTGNLMTDEKIYGTVHIAIGNNSEHPIGGVNKAPIHEDGVMSSPILAVDGKTILKNGKFLII